jgi:hypothetical protein
MITGHVGTEELFCLVSRDVVTRTSACETVGSAGTAPPIRRCLASNPGSADETMASRCCTPLRSGPCQYVAGAECHHDRQDRSRLIFAAALSLRSWRKPCSRWSEPQYRCRAKTTTAWTYCARCCLSGTGKGRGRSPITRCRSRVTLSRGSSQAEDPSSGSLDIRPRAAMRCQQGRAHHQHLSHLGEVRRCYCG